MDEAARTSLFSKKCSNEKNIQNPAVADAGNVCRGML